MHLLEYGKYAINFCFTGLIFSSILFFLCVLDSRKRRLESLARSILFLSFTASCIAFVILVKLTISKDYSSWYVWQHVSNDLNGAYLLSSIWEGQEGSFLLWIFFQSALGLVLLCMPKVNTGTLLTYSVVSAFLVSFVLGWVFIPNAVVGSTPFNSFAEKANWPILEIDRSFVPMDGSGMNLLLKNYWMIIHPPVIFFSFALLSIPFSLAIQPGKERNLTLLKNTTLLSFLFLTTGIFMGAYWAYITLNFGGYWNWDPVENAIYVPWLLLLGSFHLSVKSLNNSAHRFNILIAFTYWAVLYSTFLTRSGVLGDSSVHSFTGSGLFNQFVYLLFFMALYAVLQVYIQYKKQKNAVTRAITLKQSIIYLVVLVAALGAFQVILPTSFPVINKTLAWLGRSVSLATPADRIPFYTNFQMGIGMVLVFLLISAYSIHKESFSYGKLLRILPFAILVTSCGFLMLNLEFTGVLGFYFLLVYASLLFLWELFRGTKWQKTTSVLAHLGLVISLLGILISSAKKNVLTKEQKLLNSGEVTEVENKLIKRNEAISVGIYTMQYEGIFYKHNSDYIPEEWLSKTNKKNIFLVRKENRSLNLHAGKYIEIPSTDFFYKLKVFNGLTGYEEIIYPRIQMNAEMGGVVASPSIVNEFINDLYIHVSNFPDPAQRDSWSDFQEINLDEGSAVFGDFQFTIISEEPTEVIPGHELSFGEEARKITVTATTAVNENNYEIYQVQNEYGKIHVLPDYSYTQNLRIGLKTNAENQKVLLLSNQPKDWVVIRVIHFPWVFLTWFGAGLMVFSLSLLFIIRVSMLFQHKKKINFPGLPVFGFYTKDKLLSDENKL